MGLNVLAYVLAKNAAKKYTDDKVSKISAIGRNLAYWNCATGLPVTSPGTLPYAYQNGDYYLVSVVAGTGGTNYKPDGSSYTGAASTTVETGSVSVLDMYRYDGTTWSLMDVGQLYVATVQQSFTDAQKAQARTNIGVVTAADSILGLVSLSNKGVVAVSGDLRTVPATYLALNSGSGNYAYHPVCASAIGLATKKALGVTLDSSTSNTSWTDSEKTTARNTIGAVALAEYDSTATPVDNYLYYTTETVVSE